jgi:AraC-like DNA-binding protein
MPIAAAVGGSAASERSVAKLSPAVQPGIGRALAVLHADPAHDWSVGELAQVAGMSRSGFAARFGEVVGVSPLRYLAGWRLDRAADTLRAGPDRVATIARLVGYASETAFNRAFKARFGTTPAMFRSADRPV